MTKNILFLCISLISFSVQAVDFNLVCANQDETFYRDAAFYNREAGLAFWPSSLVNVVVFAKAMANHYSVNVVVLNFENGEKIELTRSIAFGESIKIPTPENISCSVRD